MFTQFTKLGIVKSKDLRSGSKRGWRRITSLEYKEEVVTVDELGSGSIVFYSEELVY